MSAISYGSVQYLPGTERWRIVCEPFVRARLKRVFPRAPQQAGDTLTLSATPENTRELAWFLDRFPMDVDRRDILEGLTLRHKASERALADLLAGYIAAPSVPLAEPARDYQVLAAQMLDVKDGYILADDVGLGKTVSAIAATVVPGRLPALVVCPAHLPRQWKKMFQRFAPHLNVHVLKKGTPYDLSPKKRGRQAEQSELLPPVLPDVIVSSYHKLRGWADELAGKVQFVIFDECQQLRSPGTEIYFAAVHVAQRAKKRIGLSATPIYNYGNEFFYVLDALAPEALGDHDEFVREWCTPLPNGKARLNDAKEFGAYLRREGLMLRRTRADVGRELPPLEKIVHEIDADTKVLESLKGDAVALARIVLSAGEQYRGQKMQAAGEFDALMRQATGIAKAPYVAEFVKLLLESGEPVVLFGWHRAVYDIWLEALKDFNPVLYTGTESANQKDEAVRRFTEGESKVLILSLRSGAGLDGLQEVCRLMVFGELDWSPGVHEQCMGRPHRDGQTKPCAAYFLLSDSGADPIMADVLGVKREQIENVRNPDTALAERIETGEGHLRRLAREFLAKRGVDAPKETAVAVLADVAEAMPL